VSRLTKAHGQESADRGYRDPTVPIDHFPVFKCFDLRFGIIPAGSHGQCIFDRGFFSSAPAKIVWNGSLGSIELSAARL
jgi:hypothetical protein